MASYLRQRPPGGATRSSSTLFSLAAGAYHTTVELAIAIVGWPLHGTNRRPPCIHRSEPEPGPAPPLGGLETAQPSDSYSCSCSLTCPSERRYTRSSRQAGSCNDGDVFCSFQLRLERSHVVLLSRHAGLGGSQSSGDKERGEKGRSLGALGSPSAIPLKRQHNAHTRPADSATMCVSSLCTRRSWARLN